MAALITSWLTPASFFLLLNIVIGTIFLISRLFPPKTPQHQQFGQDGYNSAPPPQRSPSLLDRVKSINFSTHKRPLQPDNLAAHPLDTDYIEPTEHDYPDKKPLSRSPSFLERVKSIDFTSFYRSDSVKSNQQRETPTTEEADSDMSPVRGQVKRSKSEPKAIQRKLSLDQKMKKSASEISSHKAEEEEDLEEVERRGSTTTRIEKTDSIGDDDQGVDAKADAFINKFKLQRWNSFLRYRDMLNGK